MKILTLLLMFSVSVDTFAFFGAEAESTKAYKAVEGALAGSILVDDINAIVKDGVDYSELEALAIEKSKTAARLKGESERVVSEYEKIKYMDEYNERSSKATKNLKRMIALYGSMCALSPESCGVAVAHEGNRKKDETNKNIEEMKIDQKKRELKRDLEKIQAKERKVKTLKAINSYPQRLFNKILSRGKKK